MGRRYYRLWPELISFENLYLAYRKAARGKRSKPAAASFEFRLEEGLLALQQELRGSGYAIILPHTSCRQAVRVG